ncbi:MAG: tripartite tricarboxylate transporter permease, partial [Beijerinckiaceae bacterium]
FQIQGLEPGPTLLSEKLVVTFSLVWTLALAYIIGAGLLLAWGKHVAKVTFLPSFSIVPIVILFMFMGAWLGSSAIGDWISLLAFGLLGWLMKLGGWPRPPLVLGYILGKIMENGLQISVQTNGWGMLTRPVTLVIFALIAVTLVAAILRHNKDKKELAGLALAGAEPGTAAQKGGEGETVNPTVSLGIDFFFLALFAWALYQCLGMPAAARFFPLVAILPAFAFLTVAILRDLHDRRVMAADWGNSPVMRGFVFYLWLVGILVVMLAIGQYPALLLFVFLYLLVWGKTKWWIATLYTAGCGIILYLIFNLVVPVLWYQSPFFSLFE